MCRYQTLGDTIMTKKSQSNIGKQKVYGATAGSPFAVVLPACVGAWGWGGDRF